MSAPRIGSLCSGYGGLELGIQSVIGGATAWVSDIDKGACKVLAHRFPGVPNIGDMTAVDWTTVEPVDVICGGTPCQDLSHAGKRAGMTEGTRSNLWVAMREAIATIRPSLVVWENVAGAYSAAAQSQPQTKVTVKRRGKQPHRTLVGGERLLAPPDGGPSLRALGRVLGDLASLGYDASWHGIRASDVGAPHNRLRVFVAAYPNDRRRRQYHPRFGSVPVAHTDSHGPLTLLPTPAVNDMGEGKTVEAWDAWTARMKAAHGNGNGHGKSLAIEALRLLPTPTVQDASNNGGPSQLERNSIPLNAVQDWGQYADAISRWESITRMAPMPAEMVVLDGSSRLNARFSEWLMGVPGGWIADVPDITRNEILRLAGNGVVPQQVAASLNEMFTWQMEGDGLCKSALTG